MNQGGFPGIVRPQEHNKVSEPDEQNRIQVEVYSLVEPDKICIQLLEPLETNIPLGSYPSGTYQVFVNGERVREFSV